MNEIEQLKIEARQLLEEVNHRSDRTNGRNPGTLYDFESVFEYSFRNRLEQLRQKIVSMKFVSANSHR